MTSNLAQQLAVGTGILAAVLCVVLFVFKSSRWWLRRRHATRRALYITAIGEIIARGLEPSEIDGWADDPAFSAVVVEYMDVVAGDERDRLEAIIRRVDLRARLIDQMGSRRVRRRLAAVSRLAVIADHTVAHVLFRALSDPVPEVRIQAARGLGVAGTESAIARLVHLLVNEEPWVAARVADQLVVFGPAAVPVLLETIRDGFGAATLDPGTVEVVVRVIGIIGDLRAGDTLTGLLTHPVADVRIVAASALGTCGTLDAVGPLIAAVRDDDWRVRARAAASLARFSDPSSLDVLFDALQDRSWWVRQNAAEALTEVPGGTGRLIDALTVDDPYARDAALFQLGLSGTIARARARVDGDDGSVEDLRLIGTVDGLGSVPETVPR